MSITRQALVAADKGYSISLMTEHDLLEVVQIEEISGLSRWGWAAYYAELHGQHSPLMLVARLDGNQLANPTHQLAGYIVARLAAGELHINNFAVRENYRGQGVGSALLNRILDEGTRRGAASAFLELRAGNAAALALYEKCGFQVTARRKRYYSDPPEDALVMSAILANA
ncbi:MAG TPA: ribosomal protein S18-alanine N-acetyltransferase [Pyrinomonadaceae bacterium]|nr:ribosomal protein S18-alanine N-acetyltransferase [Pyrinomonadaceae bacterium]